MNENEVIKAIECCLQTETGVCDSCPLYDAENGCVDTDFKLLSYALEIIKNKDIELQAMRNAANSYKAEAIKHFAERLKKNFDTYTDEEEANVLYIRDLIDKLVKEMTEGK